MTPEALAALRGSIIAKTPEQLQEEWTDGKPLNKTQYMMLAGVRNKQAAVTDLVEAINMWGAVKMAAGDTESQSYRRFFHRFGTDVLTAQTLGRPDSIALMELIRSDT